MLIATAFGRDAAFATDLATINISVTPSRPSRHNPYSRFAASCDMTISLLVLLLFAPASAQDEPLSVSYDRIRDRTSVVLSIDIEKNDFSWTRLLLSASFPGKQPPPSMKAVEMQLRYSFPARWGCRSVIAGWKDISFLLDGEERFSLKPLKPPIAESSGSLCIDHATVNLPISSLRRISSAKRVEMSPLMDEPYSEEHLALIRDFALQVTRAAK